MPVKWKSSQFKGVRYYEHPTRLHGLKRDRYFSIRYQKDKKRVEEGLGWSSEHDPSDGKFWTETKAALVLERLKKAAHLGEGPARLSEKRKLEQNRKQVEAAQEIKTAKEAITLKQYFEGTYYPIAKTHKKDQTYQKEEIHFRLWFNPEIGNKPLKDISPFDLERVKKKLLDANKAPRTIQYVLATMRQVWNMARRSGVVAGDSPTKSVKVQKFDNRRQRFLSHEEAETLLNELKKRSISLYRMAFLSLHTGMRAAEIFRLTWGCVDLDRGNIIILDAKSGHGRPAFMTSQVKTMFSEMPKCQRDDFVFLQENSKPFREVPSLFRDVVRDLGLNAHVHDPRERFCYHSLRHTFASWHAAAGTDLYVLKEILGHCSITLTERYAHLHQGSLQAATKNFEQAMTMARKEAEAIK